MGHGRTERADTAADHPPNIAAWATQLRMMRVEIMTHISVRYPDAGILSIRFQGPNAPSWKKGPRSIPGRGPRDTYG